MPRYIEAANAIYLLSLFYNYTDAERYDLALAISAIPTADVVEVVRCKDCKYLSHFDDEDIALWCRTWGNETSEDCFCKWGKRKEDPDYCDGECERCAYAEPVRLSQPINGEWLYRCTLIEGNEDFN